MYVQKTNQLKDNLICLENPRFTYTVVRFNCPKIKITLCYVLKILKTSLIKLFRLINFYLMTNTTLLHNIFY